MRPDAAAILYGSPPQASTVLSPAEPSPAAQALYGSGGTKAAAPAANMKADAPSSKPDAPKPEAEADAKDEPTQPDAGTLYDPVVPGLEGVRWNEPAATSATDFAQALEPTPIEGVSYSDNDLAGAGLALMASGVGVTGANAALSIAKQHAADAVAGKTISEAEAVSTLENWFGGQDGADAAIRDARAVVNEAQQTWPTLKQYLNETGLGSNPKFIALLAKHHRERVARR